MQVRNFQPFIAVAAGFALMGTAAHVPAQTTEPLSLAEAIASAQAHHPSLEAAQARVDLASAGLKQARASRLPTAVLGEDVTYSNDPVFAFGSKLRQGRFAQSDFSLDNLNHPDALANFSGSATVNWTALDMTSRHRIAAASASVEAADLERRYTSEQLAARVIKLYYRALSAEDQVLVAQHALERAREVDGSVTDRVHAGLSLETDGSRAHLQVKSAEDDLAQAMDNVLLARSDLFSAIGIAMTDQPLVRDSDTPGQASADQADPKQRFDIEAFDQQAAAAHQEQSAAHAALVPQISTFAHAENDAQKLVANGSGNWTVGAKVTFTVFDGGLRKAREEQAAAQARSIEAQKRVALIEVGSAQHALQAQMDDLQRRLTTAADAIGVQKATLQTARDRYASGLVPLTDVLNAETDLATAELTQVRTRYQLLTTSADLALATGTPLASKAGQQ